jgi:uncharacterized circularly permuted ATP-grasp superfamily protein
LIPFTAERIAKNAAQLADLSLLIQDTTFTVYSDGQRRERLFPFDLISRFIPIRPIRNGSVSNAACMYSGANGEQPFS